jgi:mono/diheme cytochrome c family protein
MQRSKYRFHLVLILLIALVNTNICAQNWVAPEEYNGKTGTFKFDANTQTKGKEVYTKNCQSCHGVPTQNNPVKLDPMPKDVASDALQNQTDGSIYYKISTGKGAMPPFKDVLGEEDKWNLISFIRSFNKKYVQPAIDNSAAKYQKIEIKADVNAKTKNLETSVTALVEGKRIPLTSADVVIYVKRYFGNLLVTEPKMTNMAGVAEFKLPLEIPGDKSGNAELIIKLNNKQKFGDVESKTILPVAKPFVAKSLIDQRAMWGVRSKAPIWLIMTYTLVVLGVWSVIFLILLRIRKLKKLGDKTESADNENID